MDDLFYYGLNRVEELIGDMDKINREKIRENLRAMQMGYSMQKNAKEQAKRLENYMFKMNEALKKQLKGSKTTND